MQRFTEAAELIDAEPRMKKTMWGQFWSAHQRFFKYLCIAAKVSARRFYSKENCNKGENRESGFSVIIIINFSKTVMFQLFPVCFYITL